MATINYTSRLHSTAADGKLAHASEIFDETQDKFQSKINEEVKTKLEQVGNDITQKISGVYKVKGTKENIAQVIELTPAIGDVWNVTNEFQLNGKKYPAGTNVVATAASKAEASWDALGGTIDVQDILNKAAKDAEGKANAAKQGAIEAAAQTAQSKADAAEFKAKKASSRIEGKLIKFTRIVPGKQKIEHYGFSGGGEVVYLSGMEGDDGIVLNHNGFYLFSGGKYYSAGGGLPSGVAGTTPNTLAQDGEGNLYIGVDNNRLEKIEVLNDFKTKTATAQSTADAAKQAAQSADSKAQTADGKAARAQEAVEALTARVTALENLLKLA